MLLCALNFFARYFVLLLYFAALFSARPLDRLRFRRRGYYFGYKRRGFYIKLGVRFAQPRHNALKFLAASYEFFRSLVVLAVVVESARESLFLSPLFFLPYAREHLFVVFRALEQTVELAGVEGFYAHFLFAAHAVYIYARALYLLDIE